MKKTKLLLMLSIVSLTLSSCVFDNILPKREEKTAPEETIEEPTKEPDNEFTVENKPGAALPNSGSTGTTWLYIVGSLLLLISGGTLIIRRRIQA